MARLLDLYKNDIAKAMATKFNHDNPMAIPKLTKIVINMGVGKATQDKAQLDSAVDSPEQDQRPEAGGHQGQGIGVRIPAPGGKRHRLQGDSARQADVRIPRPADLDRSAANPRLSRGESRTASTGTATTAWALPNRWSSPRSTPTRCSTAMAWISRS